MKNNSIKTLVINNNKASKFHKFTLVNVKNTIIFTEDFILDNKDFKFKLDRNIKY